jgi:thymidylate synthase (FAD)
MALIYEEKIKNGMSEEQARGTSLFDFRQHFVVSFSLRSLLHFLDLRAKKDAQLEIQQLCQLMLPHLQSWCPEVADWYVKNRWGKARLAP